MGADERRGEAVADIDEKVVERDEIGPDCRGQDEEEDRDHTEHRQTMTAEAGEGTAVGPGHGFARKDSFARNGEELGHDQSSRIRGSATA